MATGLIIAPYLPNFGTGAPGPNVPLNMPYFDTAATPTTLYIYASGAWHASGAEPAINATSLQGVSVSATTPSDGQVMTFGGSTWGPA